MEEKIIIRSKRKERNIPARILLITALISALIPTMEFLLNLRTYRTFARYCEWNQFPSIFYPIAISCAVVGALIHYAVSNSQITVSDKRVYGVSYLGMRVDLPIDSISAVGTSLFNGLAITTASGAIKFIMLANRDDLHKAISDLLAERQSNATTSRVIKTDIPLSNADELKKYKELLDMGIISQEEFNAKKKQLLGL